jgi:KDO2-lipid IV(A) lauroyltransferase
MTGAPILCGLFFMDANQAFQAIFSEPIYIRSGRGERMKEIEAGMCRYVAMLEDFIRAHPDQWYCFYPFWDDPMRSPTGQD